MRELRSCDFCADEAVGAFEIVPPALEPTEAEQRRVVCCPDCKARLESLLEPLLARLSDDEDRGSGERERTRDATDNETRGGTASVDVAPDEPSRDRAGTADVVDAADSVTAGTPETDEADADSEAIGGADSEAESDAGSLLEDGITFEHDASADEREVDSADVTELVDTAATETAAEAEQASDSTAVAEVEQEPDSTAVADAEQASESANAADDGSNGSDAESTAVPKRPPKRYNKVVRLLRNREFPMQRSAVEELAAGAYDLENDEVGAIVDYAIENGEFEQKREMLHRT